MKRNGGSTDILSQVAAIDDKIRELRIERATLLKKLNHTRSLLISRIPSEILSRIFWFAIRPRDWEGHPREPNLSDIKALFRLREVCFHWRRVTQSSPQLWSNLVLQQRRSDQSPRADNYVALVQHYFQHIGPAAMSLYLSDLGRLPGTTIDTIVEMFLKEHPRNLRSLHLRETSFWPAILKYAKENVEFAQLEELDLRWCSMSGIGRKDHSLFPNSPRLQTLSISGNGNKKIPLIFPWSQITTLELTRLSSKYCFQILGLCPNSINCDISPYDPDDRSPVATQKQITSMQSVRKLVWDASVEQDPTFFDKFRFPAVRKLRWCAPLPSEAPSVRGFFANMKELEELEIPPLCWEYRIEQHFDLFGSLTTLKADLTEDEEPLKWLYRLTTKPGKGNLLPRLQKVDLTLRDFEPDALLVLLHSRRNGPVDWSNPGQETANLTLLPYDPNSSHWQHHTRLLEFSAHYDVRGGDLDWTLSPLYDALEDMVSEAVEVEGFGECDNGLCQIVFLE